MDQQHNGRENRTEKEPDILDIFTRPEPELSTQERVDLKKVAWELLSRKLSGRNTP